MNRFVRRAFGVPRAEEVRRAREAERRELEALHVHRDRDTRAFAAEMRRRAQVQHIALGMCPPDVPYRIDLADLFATTHAWITGATFSGKSRLAGALVEEVLQLLLAGHPLAVVVVALEGDLVTTTQRALGGLLRRAPAMRRDAVLSRLLVARFAGGRFLVPWNIFACPPGVTFQSHGNTVAEVLAHVLDVQLGHRQRPSLAKLIARMSRLDLPPNALRLLVDRPELIPVLGAPSEDPFEASYFSHRFAREATSLDGIGSLLDALLGLDDALRGALVGPGTIDFRACLRPGSVSLFDFAGQGSAGRALAGLTLHALLGASQSAARHVEGPVLIVIDEVQRAFTPSTAALLADALATARHARVALALVNQSLTNLPREFVHLASTNIRYRWLGRSGEADAAAAQEFLPRAGTVPRSRPPFSSPAERPEYLSRAEELAFRIAECGALPQGEFFLTERSAPFATRRFIAPRFDPPAWNSLPADLRNALERGAFGVPRTELIRRGRAFEDAFLRSLTASAVDAGDTAPRSRRPRHAAPATPDAVTRAATWRRRSGGTP